MIFGDLFRNYKKLILKLSCKSVLLWKQIPAVHLKSLRRPMHKSLYDWSDLSEVTVISQNGKHFLEIFIVFIETKCIEKEWWILYNWIIK